MSTGAKYSNTLEKTMRYRELANVEPQVGDVLGIEFGNTLVEATIQDLRDDGVVIALDYQAVKMLSEAAAGLGSVDTYSRMAAPLSEPVLRPDNVRYPSFNKAQEPAQAPAVKRSTPARQQYSLSECKNAIDWGLRALDSASKRTKARLSQGRGDEALYYLIRAADRSNAYNEFNFNEEQLRDGEAYLGYIMNDSTIQTWNDVAKKENYQAFNESMNYKDYIKKAEALHSQYLQAIASNDKEAMERIKKERDALDQTARQGLVAEAEYHGRKVPLGKPMKGDVKKSKVYVRGPNGKVVKVNFGDPNMRIKKSSPKHRKSFRARHNCDNPGPRTKARYWSCRAW